MENQVWSSTHSRIRTDMQGRYKDSKMVEITHVHEDKEQEVLSNFSCSPTIAITSRSAISSLRSRVESWSKATGLGADILVHVHGRYFNLHKDPLTCKSRYFKRHLTGFKNKTVYVPSHITAETFSLIACFCYNSDVVITPFNVVSIRVAAQLLDMTKEDGESNGNLLQIAEAYFCQAISFNGEYAGIVFRSCLAHLHEAEKNGFLASRCIEAMYFTDGIDGVGNRLTDAVKSLTLEEFRAIADSMKERFTANHDLLYKVIDLYLEEHKGKLTEDQINRICCCIDCNKLSRRHLMHAVQNPKMPPRFIIQTMFVEHLNTRRSISKAAADCSRKSHDGRMTLGAIVRRDATLRCTEELKSTMETTSARVLNLEHELMSMKQQLSESGKKRNSLESTQSESCRFWWERKEERCEKEIVATSAPLEKPCVASSKNGKSLSRKLMSGLKNVFKTSKTDSAN